MLHFNETYTLRTALISGISAFATLPVVYTDLSDVVSGSNDLIVSQRLLSDTIDVSPLTIVTDHSTPRPLTQSELSLFERALFSSHAVVDAGFLIE
jgi:hypothetical protein